MCVDDHGEILMKQFYNYKYIDMYLDIYTVLYVLAGWLADPVDKLEQIDPSEDDLCDNP